MSTQQSKASASINLIIFCAIGIIIGGAVWALRSGGGCSIANHASGEAVGADQLNERLPESGLALVTFGASWCPPCRRLKGVLDSMEWNTVARIDVDVDQSGALAQRHSVRSIPHLLLFRDGELVDQHQGGKNRGQIEAWFAKHQRSE